MKPLTKKQTALMKIVLAGNLDAAGGRVGDVDYAQILSRLPYKTSRESLMCSLAILEKQGWLVRVGKELRLGRSRQTVAPTALATRVLLRAAEPSYVELGDDDVVILELDADIPEF